MGNGNRFQRVDLKVTRWMASRGISLLRISMDIIFFWLGMLKFFAGIVIGDTVRGETIVLEKSASA